MSEPRARGPEDHEWDWRPAPRGARIDRDPVGGRRVRNAMRKIVAILIPLCLALPALAQAPGQASTGWFVIVGTNLKPGPGKCGAGVVRGDQLGNAYYLGERFTVVPERKFWPYRSVEVAHVGLEISFSQGAAGKAVISRYIGPMPVSGDASGAAPQSMARGPPPRTAVSSAITAKVGAAASDRQSAAPQSDARGGPDFAGPPS